MASRGFSGSEDMILKRDQRMRKKRGVVASSSNETVFLVGADYGIGTPTRKSRSGDDLVEVAPILATAPCYPSLLTLLLCNCLLISFLIMGWTIVLCLLLPNSCFPLTQRF